ncbi:FAD-binding oxidoreductase, partial [bacterium]|nr:FAD-binding oxidoreductase [bacterium]
MKMDRDEAAITAAGLDRESQATDKDNHGEDERRSFADSLPLDQFFDDRGERTFASLGRVSNTPSEDFPWKLDPKKRQLIQAAAKADEDDSRLQFDASLSSVDILALAAEGARPSSVNLAESNHFWWKARAASPIWQSTEILQKIGVLGRVLEKWSLRVAHRVLRETGFSEEESLMLFKTEGFSRRTVYTRDYAVIPRGLRLLFRMVPQLIFSPRTVPQLCRFLSYANAQRIKVTPRGRGTWALGGALLTKGGVVLEMASLEKKIEVDPARHLITVSASVDFQEAEEALNEHSLTLVSRPSNKYGVIAGFLSVGEPLKGGLGLNAIDAGHIINSVDAITVATPDGETKRLDRSSEAFPFFFGTNGRNGIITEVTLKARPRPEKHHTLALHFKDEESAFGFLNSVKEDLKSSLLKVRPNHVEFYGKAYLEQLEQLKAVNSAEPQSFTINLISPEGFGKQGPSRDTVLFVFREEIDKRAFLEYVEKRNGSSLADQIVADVLWEERFYPMKLRKKGDLLTAEIILPLGEVAGYLSEVKALANKLGVTLLPVAYILNTQEALVLPQFLTDSRRLCQYYRHFTLAPILVRRAVKRFGGRPYGFGIWFSGFARKVLGKQTVRELKRAKARFDPNHILNPGKIYEIRSRLGNLLGNFLLHEKTIDLLDVVVSLQAKLLSTSASNAAFATKLDPYKRENGDALHRCIKCSACMICPLAQIWERSGDPKLMKDAIYITPRFKMEYMQRHIHEGQKLSQEDVDRFVLCFRCGVAERETVCPISDMLLDVNQTDSPCQKTLPTYDDFEAQLRREGYDVDGAIARYMDILKTHPGVANAMKEVLGNYRIPKTGDLAVLQPKTDFAVYKVEVDQDRCINCGKCGDEHTSSQRGFWDPRRPRNMVSLDDLLKELEGKIPKS